MYKIATLNKISPVGLKEFTADYEVGAALEEADGALVRSADMHETVLPANFLAVARAGAGVNNLPLDEMAAKGIVAFNTPGANANAVKELVIGQLIAAFRNVPEGIIWTKTLTENVAKAVEDGKKAFVGHEIMGKTLAVAGLGAIGRLIGHAACELGMTVTGYDPYLTDAQIKALDPRIIVRDTIEGLVEDADAVTIHIPAMPSTNGMFNEALIGRMKDGVIILNYSRDKLVDEKYLLTQLASGHVKKYVCDFPNETTINQPGVVLTPHLGASTDEAEDNCASMAAKELMDYIENGNIINSVNFPRLDLGKRTGKRVLVLAKGAEDLPAKVVAALKDQNASVTNMVSGVRGPIAAVLADYEMTGKGNRADGGLCRMCVGKIDGAVRVRVLE